MPLSEVREFVSEFASLEEEKEVRSSHALDLLAEIYSKEDGQSQKAAKAYDLLATTYDPIRSNYWDYLKSLLGTGAVAASAA